MATRAGFHHLEPGLTCPGFTASYIVPCLFYKNDCIIFLYVDDCLLFAPDASSLSSIITQLREEYNR